MAGNWDQMSGSKSKRRAGFSGTHGNLEAFILWKRCLVKVQRCNTAPLMTLSLFAQAWRQSRVMETTGETGTHTHMLPSLHSVMDMTGESSERCFLSPSLPSSQASAGGAEPGFTEPVLDWIAD